MYNMWYTGCSELTAVGTRTERGVEVPLSAGRQYDKHTATGVARVDLQLRYFNVCLKRSTALAQPAKTRKEMLLYFQDKRDYVDVTGKRSFID